MRRRSSYLVTLLAAALLLAPIAIAQGQDQDVEAVPVQEAAWVSIGDNFFDAADVSIAPGTTLMWTNEGQVPHTVTADDGSFDSGTLNPGDSYIVTFLGSGTLYYHCEIHPEMVGSITVGGAAGGGEPGPAEQQYSSEGTSDHTHTPTGY